MEDGDYNYQEAFRRMLRVKDHLRTIEEIVMDLKEELKLIKEESFLVHAMRLIIELDNKTTSPLYAHLQSPMRQTLYMIDVYYSIENRVESDIMDMNRWGRVAILLDEIEMTYFVKIGFPNDGDLYHDDRDEMIDVSLATFLGYFGNAILSYEEQTLDRITRYFTPYDDYIRRKFGFKVNEAIKFIMHIRDINNKKLNSLIDPFVDTFCYYFNNPDEWSKLTHKFIKRGITDPREWYSRKR